MKNLGKTTYIYDIIDELCPSEEYTKGPYLFNLDDINDDNHDVTFKRNLIQKLNQVYRLQWKLPDKNDELNIDTLVRLKKTEEDKSTLIWIYHGEQNSVHIRFGFNKPITNEAIITIYDNGNKVDLKNDNRLFIIQNKKRSKSKRKNKDAILSFYIRKYYPKHKWYLDVILSEKVKEQETNPKIKKYWEYFKYMNSEVSKIPDAVLCEIISDDDCMKIIRNKQYWEYRINFRGFLQYLYGESLLESKWGRRKSKAEIEIKKVISNNLVLEMAPFLKYWENLDEAGFNVIETLKDIGRVFINQLDISHTSQDRNSLLREVSERYFAEVEFLFDSVFNFNNPFYLYYMINYKRIDADKIREREQKLLEYRVFMLGLLNKWTREHLRYVGIRYRYYCEEYQDYTILKED